MEPIGILVFLLVFLVIYLVSISIIRGVFRIDHIVKVLEQTAAHLEDIKQQNKVLIEQQEEIIELLEDEFPDA